MAPSNTGETLWTMGLLYRQHWTSFRPSLPKYAKFDAIRYPSVRLGTGNNLVILRPDNFVDRITVSKIQPYSE
jgi:hypothetical protein